MEHGPLVVGAAEFEAGSVDAVDEVVVDEELAPRADLDGLVGGGLDAGGAEKLLGRGDMLFLPPGTSRLLRVQGVFTADEDINAIVDFIKKQASPNYNIEMKEKLEKRGPAVDEGGEDEGLLAQAVEIIRETQRASTSSLQRRLRIGYTRAARIMDILEAKGIIGPPRGSDPREILIDLDEEIPNNDANPSE